MSGKLRVVLDTNVLISAFISKKSKSPDKIYQKIKAQKIINVTSVGIIEEEEEVINRDYIAKNYNLRAEQRKRFIEELAAISVVLAPKLQIKAVEDDPDDDKFLSAAVEGEADYIVSGDRHLLNLGKYANIPILPPRDFAKILAKI